VIFPHIAVRTPILPLQDLYHRSRLAGYELDGQTLSPSDLIALIALRPPKEPQKGQVLDPSWTLGLRKCATCRVSIQGLIPDTALRRHLLRTPLRDNFRVACNSSRAPAIHEVNGRRPHLHSNACRIRAICRRFAADADKSILGRPTSTHGSLSKKR
jgi:hypothetical protein